MQMWTRTAPTGMRQRCSDMRHILCEWRNARNLDVAERVGMVSVLLWRVYSCDLVPGTAAGGGSMPNRWRFR